MQTPAFNLNDRLDTSSLKKALPQLAPVAFKPSRWLWLCACLTYGALALSLFAALWPFLKIYPFLLLLFVLGVLLLWWSSSRLPWRRLEGTLFYDDQGWVFYCSAGISKRLMLKGEVLIWSSLVVLPYVDTNTLRPVTIIMTKDSVSLADFARLRSWLRRYLVPKV